MPRILLLITDLQIGGTPTVVRELAIRLAGGGAAVEVACLSPWGPVADQIAAAGIPVTPFNARRTAALPSVVARLVRLIRRRRFDVVFSFLVHANVVAAAASFFSPGVRFLQSIQTTQPNPRWHWTAQAIALRRAQRIIVPSPSVARVAESWAKAPAEKLLVIPNAIDVEPFANLARQRSSSAVPRVGFIGRLDPIKRVGDLIDAIALIDRPIELHLFGEGAERQTIERRIAERKVGRRVTLHGAVAGPAVALQQIDLLVLCSAAEGFGLVLIEAMAAGVPVVATDVAGISDVVTHGQTGLLTPVADPERLAAAIVATLDDPSASAARVERAQQMVRERFAWPAVLALYRAALGID